MFDKIIVVNDKKYNIVNIPDNAGEDLDVVIDIISNFIDQDPVSFEGAKTFDYAELSKTFQV